MIQTKLSVHESASPTLASSDDEELGDVKWTPRAPIRRRTKSAARAKSPSIATSSDFFRISGYGDYVSMNKGVKSPNPIKQIKEKLKNEDVEKVIIPDILGIGIKEHTNTLDNHFLEEDISSMFNLFFIFWMKSTNYDNLLLNETLDKSDFQFESKKIISFGLLKTKMWCQCKVCWFVMCLIIYLAITLQKYLQNSPYDLRY